MSLILKNCPSHKKKDFSDPKKAARGVKFILTHNAYMHIHCNQCHIFVCEWISVMVRQVLF